MCEKFTVIRIRHETGISSMSFHEVKYSVLSPLKLFPFLNGWSIQRLHSPMFTIGYLTQFQDNSFSGTEAMLPYVL